MFSLFRLACFHVKGSADHLSCYLNGCFLDVISKTNHKAFWCTRAPLLPPFPLHKVDPLCQMNWSTRAEQTKFSAVKSELGEASILSHFVHYSFLFINKISKEIPSLPSSGLLNPPPPHSSMTGGITIKNRYHQPWQTLVSGFQLGDIWQIAGCMCVGGVACWPAFVTGIHSRLPPSLHLCDNRTHEAVIVC